MTAQFLPRRQFLLRAAGAAGFVLVPGLWRPLGATPAEVKAEIAKLVGEAALRPGLVKLDLPVLVESPNAVGMTVTAGTPPAGTRIQSFHVFAAANPLPNVGHFHFGPRAGRPRVSTHIRLADSQTVTAIAKLSDGSCWSDSVDLLVTLSACLD
ncbi:MAG: sulfur oxidation protein SoxY [Alphaproteobacteria bacterium]|nr:sulfur oxidation protein SoxY [Alphaproteobacteria bacterium]